MKQYIAAGLLFFSVAAVAGFVDGNKLNAWAQADARSDGPNSSNKDFSESRSYYGYLRGAFDSHEDVLTCIPDKFTAGQMAAIVTTYLQKNPDKWHLSGDVIVVLALRQAFPCSKK